MQNKYAATRCPGIERARSGGVDGEGVDGEVGQARTESVPGLEVTIIKWKARVGWRPAVAVHIRATCLALFIAAPRRREQSGAWRMIPR